MLTAEVVRATSAQPLHLASSAHLLSARVSSESMWLDAFWQLDNPSIGQRRLLSRVSWSITFADGSNLLHRQHEVLLDWLRRLIWSLFVDPRDKAKPYKVGNAGMLTQGMRVLVPWLFEQSITLPHQLDRTSVDRFVEDLPALVADDAEDEAIITEGMVYMPLKVIDLVWRQRAALQDAGFRPMPEIPWDKRGANTIARRVATEVRGWIQPLPDEVAIPILNKAAWFLGKPADDIISLREGLEAATRALSRKHRDSRPITRGSALVFQRSFADSYTFQTPDGDAQPWHASLETYRVGKKFRSIVRVRQLVAALVPAACIAIQSSTGMRASEICGLRAGTCPETGLPNDVRIVPSASGLNEVFVLRSPLTKREGEPRDEDWLLGMRPIGSAEVPLPVRAIQVLDRLLQPERCLAESGRLLVSNSIRHGFPRSGRGVSQYTSGTLNDNVKAFVRTWVDLSGLPDESQHRTAANDLIRWRDSQGGIIRPHQFRPTYAHFALAVDSRLLPAVQRQFHHVAMAMTEQGYWGANRIQIEPIDSVSSQLTAMRLYELATGRSKVAGRRGATLTNNIQRIRDLTEGLSIEGGWRAVVRFVRDNRLSIWFSPHGDCFPEDIASMECHKQAGTRPLGNMTPNFATRNPTICSGCKSYIVDLRHRGFHERRYVENLRAVTLSKELGMEGQFRIASARANASARLLSFMGVGVEALAGMLVDAREPA